MPLVRSNPVNQGVLIGLVIGSLALSAACGPVPAPTQTPRPTLPPRTPPTPLPEPEVAGEIRDGETISIALPGGAFAHLNYTPSRTQEISITARATSDDGSGNVLDPVLSILNDEDIEVAYNDDHAAQTDSLAASDAHVRRITVEYGEIYTIRVNAFNGFQRGQIDVTVDVFE